MGGKTILGCCVAVFYEDRCRRRIARIGSRVGCGWEGSDDWIHEGEYVYIWYIQAIMSH